jgi:hypothetical protein
MYSHSSRLYLQGNSIQALKHQNVEGVVVVWLFIGTQKRLVALHSALVGSRRDGHTARAV